jgi:hypothetical protein
MPLLPLEVGAEVVRVDPELAADMSGGQLAAVDLPLDRVARDLR